MAALRLLLASILLVPGLALAADEPEKVASVEGITEYRLDNGLRFLLFPDASQPTVTVNMTVLVGSRHEGYGEAGMAHLLEHMVFKGTPMHPNVPQALRDRGASFNGTTWLDRTNYFETFRSSDDNLEFAIRFEADRLVNSFIRREDLLSEMTVVRNEFERSENSPAGLLNSRVTAVAFDWHNYGKTTIGNRSDIERVPIDNLQDFYRRYYQPDNVVLIVAGKFDEAKAKSYIQQYFGALPRPTRKLNKTYTEEPPQDGERRVELRRVGDVAIVQTAYHVPAAAHEDHAPLAVLAGVLSTQPSGRLYKSLVETKKASRVSADAGSFQDPSLFDVTAEVRDADTLPDVEATLLATLQEVIDAGVTQEEVDRVKQNFLNARRAMTVNTSYLAVELSNWVGKGDWRLYFLHRDRMEKVTPADVQRVAAKYLVKSNRTVGYFIPSEKTDYVTIPQTPDIKELVGNYEGRPPVAPVPEFEYTYANVESKTTRSELSSGINTALLPKPTRDEVVTVSLTLRYGTAENLKHLRDAAELLPTVMLRGTKKLSYQELRDKLTQLDVTINASGDPGEARFYVRARRGTLKDALELLRQILREPALDSAEFELVKLPRLARLEEMLTDPDSLSTNLVARRRSPYPEGDIRATRAIDVQIEQLKDTTAEQVQKLYNDYFGAVAGEAVAVGDFDAEATREQLDSILADWKPQEAYQRIAEKAFTDVAASRDAINTPDKANAKYTAGWEVAVSDSDDDYPSLVLANYIFGGSGLSARLADRVRQKEGLSYGVNSSFYSSPEDKLGRFTINAIFHPENVEKVETAIREELQRLVDDGIPDDELRRSKEGLLQALERSRASDAYMSSRLERGLRVDRTLEFDEQIEKQISELTADRVMHAVRKHMDPKRLIVVVAGDFEKEEPASP